MHAIQRTMLLSVAFLLGWGIAPVWAQAKTAKSAKPAAPKATPAASGQASSLLQGLSFSDLEVVVIMKDGSELPGFVKEGRFFSEYQQTTRSFDPSKQSFLVKTIDLQGKPQTQDIVEGAWKTGVDFHAVAAVMLVQDIPGLHVVVSFPDFLKGTVAVPYERIDYVELHDYVSLSRLKEVQDIIEKKATGAKLASAEKSQGLATYFTGKKTRDNDQKARKKLQDQVNNYLAQQADRKKLVERFPPDHGWDQKKFEAIGKEYVGTLGYVDPEEDVFYKNYEAWKTAVQEAAAMKDGEGAYLTNLFPAREGWDEQKKDNLLQTLLGGGGLSDLEALFVYKFDELAKAQQKAGDADQKLLTEFPPAAWSAFRKGELEKKKADGDTLTPQEQKFLDVYPRWENARRAAQTQNAPPADNSSGQASGTDGK